jgi:hypothetical protein
MRHRWFQYLTFALINCAVCCASNFAAAEPRDPALANISDDERAEISTQRQPVERVTFIDGKPPQPGQPQPTLQQRTVVGRILLEAQDGGMLLEATDGQQFTIEGKSVLNRQKSDTPFKPLTPKELAEQLVATLPPGFRVHTTPHYVVCYNTSREYGEWTSSLFERLYKAFTSYWRRQGMELREPEFPLVVVAFSDRPTYEAAARGDLGDAARNIVGYYNLKNNQVFTYDLTGAESVRNNSNRRGSLREINQMLSQRAAVPLVATVVHEATHQIAFNCGLQTRLSDIPLWLCEGMAVYFEAPDLTSSRGWRGIGRVNYPRLTTFRKNLPNWRRDSLVSLIADNTRFRDPSTAIDAYADAWALNYFLIKYRPKQYASYLKMLADKPPLMEDDPDTRLAEFKQHFGDLRSVERDFLQKMSRVE